MSWAGEGRMRSFWDRRASEDAFYFVDNRLKYGRRPDMRRFWSEGQRDLDRLLGLLELTVRPTDVVVEIGCGVGRLTRHLAARAAEVVAIDVSGRMLAIARKQNPGLPNVRWLLGDGQSLVGVEDASADLCLSTVVFQHIPDPEVTLAYVREAGRVIRPGGRGAFQLSNDPRVHRPVRRSRLGALARAAVGRLPGGQEAPEWLGSAVRLDALEAAAADGGMELQRVVGAGTQFCLVRVGKPPAARSGGARYM